MGEFLGWKSYDLEGWCDKCGWYWIDYKNEHIYCTEEQDSDE